VGMIDSSFLFSSSVLGIELGFVLARQALYCLTHVSVLLL
jgi:hypothetical protein